MYPTAHPDTGPVLVPAEGAHPGTPAASSPGDHVAASDSAVEERIAAELTDVLREWYDDAQEERPPA